MAEYILGKTNESLIVAGELESYSSLIQSKVEGKATLTNRIKFLNKERNRIGRLNINDPNYVYKYGQLETIDRIKTEIESGIGSSGAKQMIGEATRRFSFGPVRRKKTPIF